MTQTSLSSIYHTEDSSSSPDPVRSLVEAYLAEHRALGAAERFARWHDAPLPARRPGGSGQERYRRLLPASPLLPGRQLAFEVDLDACSGCKACVTACHSLNGLDSDESWRTVGLLVAARPPSDRSPPPPAPSLQHVTHACHHCLEPACSHGCPVLAYDKDPLTGIVRHLDDQCIGCSYCQMTCPYDVPRYSRRLGIVRKCDMCHDRLAVGEPPACAQSCPGDAIRIVQVPTEPGRDDVAEPSDVASFLPQGPAPSRTGPTSRYRSTRSIEEMRDASDAVVVPAPAHSPLVTMLVLTQVAAGLALVEAGLRLGGHPIPGIITLLTLAVLSTGMAASILHLGQPLRAWRAFLGWRRSWLSREILLLNLFAALGAADACFALGLGSSASGPILPPPLLGVAKALAGLASVYASVRVYSATGRKLWSWPGTAARFFGTTLTAALAAWLFAGLSDTPWPWWLLASLVTVRLLVEERDAWHSCDAPEELQRTSRLLGGRLRSLRLVRILLSSTTMILLAIPVPVGSGGSLLPAILAGAVLFASDLLERTLFFRAVSPDRMPGQPA